MEYKHRLSELDTYLFAKGTHYEIYEKMGAHLAEENGEKGTYFAEIGRASCRERV